MAEHSPVSPALPCISVDFNALHEAALAGRAVEAIAPGGAANLTDEAPAPEPAPEPAPRAAKASAPVPHASAAD